MKNITKRNSLIALFFVFVLSFVIGCMPTYIGNPETAKIDPQYIGIWHAVKNSDHQLWVIHQLNDHTYLTQGYFIKAGEDGKLNIDSAVTARAWLADIAGQKFVSMETYSANLFTDTDADKTRYLVANVSNIADGFVIKHVAPDFFKGKTIAKPEELEKVIADNINNKDLYLEPVEFKKVDPKVPGKLKDMIDLIK